MTIDVHHHRRNGKQDTLTMTSSLFPTRHKRSFDVAFLTGQDPEETTPRTEIAKKILSDNDKSRSGDSDVPGSAFTKVSRAEVMNRASDIAQMSGFAGISNPALSFLQSNVAKSMGMPLFTANQMSQSIPTSSIFSSITANSSVKKHSKNDNYGKTQNVYTEFSTPEQGPQNFPKIRPALYPDFFNPYSYLALGGQPISPPFLPPNPVSTLLPPSLTALSLPAQNICAKCNVGFRMTSDLVYHMRSHHKREADPLKRKHEEKLKCPVCNESFRERHHLTRHMTAHQDKDAEASERIAAMAAEHGVSNL